MKQSKTEVIVEALRIASRDIIDECGVTSAMMVEAALRLEEAHGLIVGINDCEQVTRDQLRRDLTVFLMHGFEDPSHPCVNQCTPNRSICRGCFRTDEERANWASKSPVDKIRILEEIKSGRMRK